MISALPAFTFTFGQLLNDVKVALITIVAFALVFGLLAFSHEFGHFITAKMLGMSVDQFGMGMPPNYGWTLFRRSGTSYTVHPIPVGAFVRIQGMDPGDPDTPNSFMRQPPWARLIVLVAGSAGNMVLAILIFLLMAVTVGLPERQYETNQVQNVVKHSPAAAAGLRPGDTVVAVRRFDEPGAWLRPRVLGQTVDASALVEFIHHSYTWETVKGKRVPVGLLLLVQVMHKDGSGQTIKARPAVHTAAGGQHYAALGYTPGIAVEYRRMGWVQAVGGAFDTAWGNALSLVEALRDRVQQVISHEITPSEFGESFGGTVTIAAASGHFAQRGFADFLSFVGILSINLAVLNLLPLPVFDGGNIIIVLLEVVRRKQLKPSQLMVVQLAGVVLIACIFAYLTYNDIRNLAHHRWMP